MVFKMPFKFETENLKIPKEMDRRRKLNDEQRKEIKKLYGKISQRKLAKMFNVSRRLIVFIGDPDQYKKNLENRKLRGGSAIYYDKNKQKKYAKVTRKYKKQLYDEKLLEGQKWKY